MEGFEFVRLDLHHAKIKMHVDTQVGTLLSDKFFIACHRKLIKILSIGSHAMYSLKVSISALFQCP